MKNFSNLLMLLCLLGATPRIQAQTMSLENCLANADAVFEGKVVSSVSFWDKTHSRIYTRHQIQPTKVFKGFTSSGLIEVISQGGEVEETFQIICHETELPAGTEGVFFCKKFEVPGLYSPPLMLNGSYGFVSVNKTGIIRTAIDQEVTYTNLQKQLYPKLGNPIWTSSGTAQTNGPDFNPDNDEEEIVFAFDNMQMNGVASISFDIYVKSTNNSVQFAGGDVYLKYSPAVFGEFIVANNNLTLSKGEVIEDSGYTLSMEDSDKKTLHISVDANCREPRKMYELSNEFEEQIWIFTRLFCMSLDMHTC